MAENDKTRNQQSQISAHSELEKSLYAVINQIR
jgi:hypothetical protein